METSITCLVSIIIPCYNAEKWIAECLESAIAQIHRPLEVIVIDDGSTDGSLDIIKQFAEHYPELITYETGANRGGCAARNRGFVLSQGTFVIFLDADDYLESGTVTGQVDALDGCINAIAVCPWWSIEWNGQEWVRHRHPQTDTSDPLVGELRYGNFIPVQALLWPRNVIAQLGGWDETLWANQDGDLRLRALLSGYQFIQSNVGGFVYRRYSANTVSGATSLRALESRIRIMKKVEAALLASGRLEQYRLDLARAFHSLASMIMPLNEDLGVEANQRAMFLGGRQSIHGTLKHRLLCFTIGLKRKERLARWIGGGSLSWIMQRSQMGSRTNSFERQISKKTGKY